MGYPVTRSVVGGEEVMPVPEGQITGSQIWQSPIQPVEEVVEEVKEEVEEDEDDL